MRNPNENTRVIEDVRIQLLLLLKCKERLFWRDPKGSSGALLHVLGISYTLLQTFEILWQYSFNDWDFAIIVTILIIQFTRRALVFRWFMIFLIHTFIVIFITIVNDPIRVVFIKAGVHKGIEQNITGIIQIG